MLMLGRLRAASSLSFRPGRSVCSTASLSLLLFTVCLLMCSRRAEADTILSAQFGATNFGSAYQGYSGVEPDAASSDAAFANANTWNHLTTPGVNGPISFANLVDSTGAKTGASFGLSFVNGGFNNYSGNLPDSYFFSKSGPNTFRIAGLAPGTAYTLFLYAFTDGGSRSAVFQVGTSAFSTVGAHASSEDPQYAVDGSLSGVTDTAGVIHGTWSFGAGNTDEIDWSGFQLDLQQPAAATTPEPAPFVLLGTGLLSLVGAARRRLLS